MWEKSLAGHTTCFTSVANRPGSFWRRRCYRNGLSTCIGKRLVNGLSNIKVRYSFRWSSGFFMSTRFWISNIISCFSSLDLFYKYPFRAGSGISRVISFAVKAAFWFLICFAVVSYFCTAGTGNGTTT